MNYKNAETDSGKYVNGIYTTKNGFSGLGLNCPKGTRLYNTELEKPIFFVPDIQKGEQFKMITDEVAPGIMPYYAISNYGRIENIFTEKIMKPNYRPNGYEYYCLAASGSKTNQKKYSTSRLVMKTFEPREDMDNLEVNNIYGDKTKNYLNKLMPDGTYDSSIEWTTPQENCIHAEKNNLRDKYIRFSQNDVDAIRKYHDEGYSYEQIIQQFYPNRSMVSIQNICKNLTYVDPYYQPKVRPSQLNPANVHKLTSEDAKYIRELHEQGLRYETIKNDYFPEFSIAAISDICRFKTHNDV
jgi:hypothetical protein